MNLVLIGYRGTGKSTVGMLLAKQLDMRYFSVDDEVVKKAGMAMPEIIEKYGWTKFRDIESEVTRELTWFDNYVIDTSSGIIERVENIKDLQSNAYVYWLKAELDTILTRIEAGTQRPTLTSGKSFTEDVAKVLGERTPIYESAAHYIIDTNNLSPQQVIENIIELWMSSKDCTSHLIHHAEDSDMILLKFEPMNNLLPE